ncbi:hypothetical protein Q6331_30935, partial [Klebsiella pneumoniae]|nr:hypothetical protein [Klebsiella pneumoniae]
KSAIRSSAERCPCDQRGKDWLLTFFLPRSWQPAENPELLHARYFQRSLCPSLMNAPELRLNPHLEASLTRIRLAAE